MARSCYLALLLQARERKGTITKILRKWPLVKPLKRTGGCWFGEGIRARKELEESSNLLTPPFHFLLVHVAVSTQTEVQGQDPVYVVFERQLLRSQSGEDWNAEST